MADNKGQPAGLSDEMTMLAILVVALIVIYVVWNFARHPVVWAMLGPDFVQLWLLDAVGLLNPAGQALLKDVRECLDGTFDVYSLTWEYIMGVSRSVGLTYRLPFAVLIAGAAVWATFKMKGDGFRRQYSLTGRAEETIFRVAGHRIDNKLLQAVIRLLLTVTFTKKMLLSERKEWVRKGVSFMHFQAEHWKVALAGANFDPNADDDDQAPQKTPMEWMRDNKIKLTKREGLDEEGAERAFQQQLGPVWQGVEKAPTHVQAICVLAGLNADRSKKVDSLRGQLTSLYVGGAKEEQVKAALAPFLADKKLVAKINCRGSKHAFTNTACLGIYGWGGPMKEWGGGEAGVLATSMFRWLKKVDRGLWYCLNNVGRRAFHVEGAGAVAHFFSERVVGGPLAEAHVDEAVEGLATYIDDQGLMDLDEFFRVDKD